MDVKNIDLFPEYAVSNPVWRTFVETWESVMELNVNSPLRDLQGIRNLNQNSDPELIRRTLRLLGFDVTHDFLTLNDQKVLNTLYMFSQYYQNSHNYKYTDFISFVLGRSVKSENLYTKDYISFYPRPYGDLVINGGDWYKTTHIDVSVDTNPSSVNDGIIIASPTRSIQQRIIDIFYEYCPINLVVRNFYFSTNMSAQFYITGAVYSSGTLREVAVGGPGLSGGRELDELLRIEISGYSSIYEQGVYRYQLILVWNTVDGSEYVEPVSFTDFASSDSSYLRVLSFGYVQVLSIPETVYVNLTAHYAGKTATKRIQLINVDTTLKVTDLIIEGPSRLPENVEQSYKARLIWDNGQQTLVGGLSNLTWSSSNTTVAEFIGHVMELDGHVHNVQNDGTLTVYSVQTNTEITLTARFTNTNNTVVSSTFRAQVINYSGERFVQYILILPISENEEDYLDGTSGVTTLFNVYENRTYKYHCYAYYSDNTVELIYPDWKLNTSAASIDIEGTLTTYDISQTLMYVRLEAQYTYRGVTSVGFIRLNFRQLNRTVALTEDSYYIAGPDSIPQNSQMQYDLRIKWSDRTAFVSVKPDDWIPSRYSMSKSGLLTTGSVDDDGDTIVLEARFYYDNSQFVVYKSVYVYREPPSIAFIGISGPMSIEDNGNTSYYREFKCYSYWSDKGRKAIESTATGSLTWSITPSTFAVLSTVIDPISSATVARIRITSTPTSSFITLKATYITNGVTYTTDHHIAISSTIRQLKSITIDGPSDLIEFDIQRYTCQAAYTDNSNMENVNPVWSVENTDVNIDDVALVNTLGDVSILRNDTNTSFRLKARYYNQVATKLITVSVFNNTDPAPPESYWIEGLDLIPATLLPAQYTLWVKEGGVNVAYGADWSLDVDETVAEIDSEGYLVVYKFDGRVIEITASRYYGYSDAIIAKKRVKIPTDADVGQIDISGTDVMYERETYSFVATTIEAAPVNVTSTPYCYWKIESTSYPEATLTLNEGELKIGTMEHPEISVVISATYFPTSGHIYTGQKTIALYKIIPKYGIGSFGIDTYASASQICVNAMDSSYSEETFHINVPSGKYGYYMHPVELGMATFINLTEGKAEPWNGAKWGMSQTSCTNPDVTDPNSDCGPLIVQAPNRKQFYLYRTNRVAIGSVDYKVMYSNL